MRQNNALREKLNFCFSGDFSQYWQNLYFVVGLSTKWSLYEVLKLFWYFQVLSHSATREATSIYQFITNNHALFHMWWKENLLNHQKASKYYGYDCRYGLRSIFCFKSKLLESIESVVLWRIEIPDCWGETETISKFSVWNC